MCDAQTEADNAKQTGQISRREFNAFAGVSGLGALLPDAAVAGEKPSPVEVERRTVRIETPDGVMDASYAAPKKGRAPAILVCPDIMGIRPAFELMGEHLAGAGFSVLTINPFYRSVAGQFMQPGESYADPAVRAKIAPWRALLTAEAMASDAVAAFKWLDQQPEVDASRGGGVSGYCMGGPFAMRAAAALPDRIKAGASFHGSGLATDAPDSPHRLVPRMRARFLVAVAENDDVRNPAEKDQVRAAFTDVNLPVEVEVYAGANHGWCVIDSAAFHPAQAARAWGRLLETFKTL